MAIVTAKKKQKDSAISDDLRTINNAIDLIRDCENKELISEQLDCIATAIGNIDSEFDDLQDENKQLEEKVTELENEEPESDLPIGVDNIISIEDCRDSEQWNLGNTAIYASNLRDAGVLEDFARSLRKSA